MPWAAIIPLILEILKNIKPEHIALVLYVIFIIADKVPQLHNDPTFQKIKELVGEFYERTKKDDPA